MIPGLLICAWVLDSQLRMFHAHKESQEMEQLKKEMESMEPLNRSGNFQQERPAATQAESSTDKKVADVTSKVLPVQYEKRSDGLEYPIFTPLQGGIK